MSVREVEEIIVGRPASDGDGVKLTRVFGGGGNPGRFDPYLMMDEFGSDEAADYIGGFPAHPHRGFETITYMLEGHMEHQDHMGNVGELKNGDVQWMTAGAGVIHSEMPQQKEGRMRGFQIWLNLPAAEKMQPAAYNDIRHTDIPVYRQAGVEILAIAGQLQSGDVALDGVVREKTTDPGYLDVHLGDATHLLLDLPDTHTALVYVYEGQLQIGDKQTRVEKGRLARLSTGTQISVDSFGGPARAIVLSGKPIGEPIAQYGPFVMNTTEEIEQALRDYRAGTLAQ